MPISEQMFQLHVCKNVSIIYRIDCHTFKVIAIYIPVEWAQSSWRQKGTEIHVVIVVLHEK